MNNFRKKLYPRYKAHRRPPTRRRLGVSISLTKKGWCAVVQDLDIDQPVAEIKLVQTWEYVEGHALITSLLGEVIDGIDGIVEVFSDTTDE